MRQWALRGAEQRLLEIAEEAAAIHATFPELREGRRGGRMPRPATGRGLSTAAGGDEESARRGGRRRRQLSPEARKRISDAQKARWARQRAGGKKR
jgi:hypothetical protein